MNDTGSPPSINSTYAIATLIMIIGLIYIWTHPKYDSPHHDHQQPTDHLGQDHHR